MGQDDPTEEEWSDEFELYFTGFYHGVVSDLNGESDLAVADEFTDADSAMERLHERCEQVQEEGFNLDVPFYDTDPDA